MASPSQNGSYYFQRTWTSLESKWISSHMWLSTHLLKLLFITFKSSILKFHTCLLSLKFTAWIQIGHQRRHYHQVPKGLYPFLWGASCINSIVRAWWPMRSPSGTPNFKCSISNKFIKKLTLFLFLNATIDIIFHLQRLDCDIAIIRCHACLGVTHTI